MSSAACGSLRWKRTVCLSSTVTRSTSARTERVKAWPILGSLMRSMFHLTDSASIVWPLWYSAPRRSLKVQVLRSDDASHDSATPGLASILSSKSTSPPVMAVSGVETK